ncbi:dnaJ homolog subfamily C member 17 [Salmo trutta]|uniref:dnaJ homolog subfamily C member 17 n=1 Tax=Salmo trutta TaxID=8032 RepID=UPI001130DC9D|nr:dnaJ homolog subfamily C member 17-like [Salmo trutta]
MTGKTAKDLLQMDLYGLLGIKDTATAKEIKKAYRQKALTCHPDKNPDNPKAADLFHQLSQALEVLTDAAARAAYDKICAAKKQAEERNNKLDAKRRKIKLDLEARERQAEAHSAEQFQNTRTLEEEIARLREEGSRQLQEEQRLIKEQIQRERETQLHHTGTSDYTSTGTALNHTIYIYIYIYTAQKRFSPLSGRSLVVKSLYLSFVNLPVPVLTCPCVCLPLQGALSSERDYESVVLMKMRQAAERQRLIDEMQREDEENAA